MSVVTFFSAKGAPGATTAAMLAASLWPRPALLADCDPAGGDVGLRLPAPDGRPLDLNRGVLSLLPMARRTLVPEALTEHVQDVLGGGQVLVGLTGPEQAFAGGPVWETIADAFAGVRGYDVIVDAGRLHQRSPVLPLLMRSDLAICTLGTSLSNTYSTRARLHALLAVLAEGGAGPRPGIVVRSSDRRESERAAEVIRADTSDVRYFGHLAEDPAGAGIFDGRPVSRPERTVLVRSGRTVVDEVLHELARLELGRIDPAEQPWNTLTGEFAAYAPLLAPTATPADGDGAQPPVAPRRSRLEERKFGQTRRFRRGRSERAEPARQAELDSSAREDAS